MTVPRLVPAVVTAVSALLLTACEHETSPTALATASTGACPTPSGGATAWPAPVPASLPVPPGLAITSSRRNSDGTTLVQFTAPLSFRQAARYLVDLRTAGVVPKGGDAESREIDQPFTAPGYRGAFSLHKTGDCSISGSLSTTSPIGSG